MSNVNSLLTAISLTSHSDTQYLWHPTSQWYQGRGVYGGLLFAAIANSLEHFSRFPIRRLNIDLCAPIKAKETTVNIREMRRGTNTQFIQVECLQEGKIVSYASATCGGERISELDLHSNRRSDPYPQGEAIPFHPSMPSFSRFFEYWPTLGSLPFSNASHLLTGGWIRCSGVIMLSQPLICALIDAWWPALFLAIETPRPMGTISCSIDFTHPALPSVHPNAYLLENLCTDVRDGYSVEHNRLWAKDGTLLAICQQLLVVIR